MRDGAAGARWRHCHGTRERHQTRYGSVACSGVSGIHDQALPRKCCDENRVEIQRRRTVNSLYNFVKPLRQYCSNLLRRTHTNCRTSPPHEGTTSLPCFKPMLREPWRAGCPPRGWSRPSPPACRYRPACGARSSLRGRSATSSRGRSRSCAASRPHGWIRRVMRKPLHRSSWCSSIWRSAPGGLQTVPGKGSYAHI